MVAKKDEWISLKLVQVQCHKKANKETTQFTGGQENEKV